MSNKGANIPSGENENCGVNYPSGEDATIGANNPSSVIATYVVDNPSDVNATSGDDNASGNNATSGDDIPSGKNTTNDVNIVWKGILAVYNGIVRICTKKRQKPEDDLAECIKNEVQIMDSAPTPTTDKFSSALIEKCFDAKWIKLKRTDKPSETSPLILLCPTPSRLKSDVDFALTELKHPLPPHCVMIIIHTGIERNLPIIPSDQKLKSEFTDYNHITFIDMGFDHDRSISCNMDAIEKLKTYIDKFFPHQKETNLHEPYQTSPVDHRTRSFLI